MGRNLADFHDDLLRRRTVGIYDDFTEYVSAHRWTTVASGSATATVGDNAYGILTLAAVDSTDNRDVYVRTTNEVFLFVANKPIVCECLLQFTEANTDAANVIFGLMNAVAANALVDDGAGPKVNFSGAVIYKVDGGTQWKTCSSLATTQHISQSDTDAGGSSYQRLRIEIAPVSSTICEVTYYVDGKQLKVADSRSAIKDQLTYTSATEMHLFVGLKNGSTTAESLLVDYIAAEQLARRFT